MDSNYFVNKFYEGDASLGLFTENSYEPSYPGISSVQTIYIKSSLYDATKDIVENTSTGGAFVFNEIVDGYAKYLYDSTYGQNDSNGDDSCS